ncbi:MAG TPA: F0F1 ATP synthase subunit A [Solirubrobacteraceae bacterium]|jgi:F-type H+-transporting ATPase subunit a|nr:F0F1 ATP synthase subunit A [Solirubrobacteraceae bacterium]
MSTGKRIALIVGGIYLFLVVLTIGIFGWSRLDNDEFKPQNEFKLDAWIELGPFDFTKAVLYLLIASALTIGTMVFVSRRMQARPNRVQTAVEWLFTAMRDNITRGNMDDAMARKWFPFIGALFLFIWFSNLIGYVPLPTNTHEKVDILGVDIPSFALYAATANLSVPLVLALVVFVAYNVEGIRAKGLGGYLKSLIPDGIDNPFMKGFVFVLEFLSNFMRLISLSVRLFANILAGHLIILFMSGGLAVLLGIEALGVIIIPAGIAIFLFEVGLVATLQAFIFATLTAIYLGGAVAEHH